MGYRKLFQDHKDGEYNNILTIPKVRISKFWPNKSEEFYKNIPKLWEITKNYSLSECYSLEHFFKAMTTVCSCSNIYLGLIFRHHLKLINQKAGIFLIYTPSILASGVFNIGYYASDIFNPMLTNPLSDHKKYAFKSILSQVLSAYLYPFLFTSVTSVYVAYMRSTFVIPDDFIKSPESRKYIWDKIYKPVLSKSRNGLIILLLTNIIFAFGLVLVQSNQISDIYQKESIKQKSI